MRCDARILRGMKMTVYCFSGAGHSRAVADFFAEELCCQVTELDGRTECGSGEETAVVVFPVYCQNIPGPVREFLKRLKAECVVLAVTYGGISWGNVLYEARRLLRGRVIAGVCVPTGHTFLREDAAFDAGGLLPVLERIRAPREAVIPKSHKNPFSDFFPAWRSRIGVRIIRTDACRRCGLCGERCPAGAIRNGRPGSGCFRCMRCVTACPHNALKFENSPVLDAYLRRFRKDELKLYL